MGLVRKKNAKTKTMENLHVSMRADLHRRLIKALEALCTDSTTLRGAFYRWRARAAQATKMLKAVDDLTGANADAECLVLDASIHRAIVDAADRITPTHQLILDAYHGARDAQERAASRHSRFAAAESGVVRVAPAPDERVAVGRRGLGGGVAISPFAS